MKKKEKKKEKKKKNKKNNSKFTSELGIGSLMTSPLGQLLFIKLFCSLGSN